MRTTAGYHPLLCLLCSAVALCSGASAAWDGDFQKLFDGRSLAGWQVEGKGDHAQQWKVVDGCIVTENKTGPGSNLWTQKSYRNYELKLEFQTLSKDYDTGVFLRGDGHQVQIGISGSLKVDMTACIYAPIDKRGGYPGKTDKVTAVNQVGKWNTLRIVLQGKRVQTFLNKEPMVDYQCLNIKREGPIGLQLHGGREMKVRFRNIQLRVLE